jgi:hypothetical protein
MATAEFKMRNTAIACTGDKGKCDLPRMTVAELGGLVPGIHPGPSVDEAVRLIAGGTSWKRRPIEDNGWPDKPGHAA